MESLDLLRRKIATTEEMQEVVKIMKTIAAISIRQYQRAVESLGEYNRTVEMGLQIILRSTPEELVVARPDLGQRLGAIILGSELGMCGQFNEQMASHALKKLGELQARQEDRLIMAVGARLLSRLEEEGERVQEHMPLPGSTTGIAARVQEVVLKIQEWQTRRGVDRVVLFYHRLISSSAYRPQTVLLWPVDLEWLQDLEKKPWPSRVLPTFTMPRKPLLKALLSQYLFVSLFRAFAESLASENASRLMSM